MTLGLTSGAIHPRVADELTWRWQQADGDMGLHSNFTAMIAMIESGGHGRGQLIAEIGEHCVKAAAKVRHIDRALAQLDGRDVEVLFAVCGAPTEDLAALLRAIPAARKAHALSGPQGPINAWGAALFERAVLQADPPACRLASAIRHQARALLARASGRYIEARRRL